MLAKRSVVVCPSAMVCCTCAWVRCRESASVPVQNASQVASEKISNAELGMASSVGALFSANKKRKSLAAPVSSNIGNAMAKKSSGSRSKKKKKGKFGNFSGW